MQLDDPAERGAGIDRERSIERGREGERWFLSLLDRMVSNWRPGAWGERRGRRGSAGDKRLGEGCGMVWGRGG